MGKNFINMPFLLKLFALTTLVVPLFVAQSLFSNQSIEVFGEKLTMSQWWSCCAGIVSTFTGCIMLIAGFLLLKRSYYGRFFYVLAWVVMSLSIPIVGHLVHSNLTSIVSSLVPNIAVTVFIGVYLYTSNDVKNYFSGESLLSK